MIFRFGFSTVEIEAVRMVSLRENRGRVGVGLGGLVFESETQGGHAASVDLGRDFRRFWNSTELELTPQLMQKHQKQRLVGH